MLMAFHDSSVTRWYLRLLVVFLLRPQDPGSYTILDFLNPDLLSAHYNGLIWKSREYYFQGKIIDDDGAPPPHNDAHFFARKIARVWSVYNSSFVGALPFAHQEGYKKTNFSWMMDVSTSSSSLKSGKFLMLPRLSNQNRRIVSSVNVPFIYFANAGSRVFFVTLGTEFGCVPVC